MGDSIKSLMKSAIDARLKAYAQYSKFRVGAALLCEDGTVFTGCNVENAAYGLAICAERVAIVKAVSEGHKKFSAIAVSSAGGPDISDCEIAAHVLISPCGACRQFMVEFGNYDVYLVHSNGNDHQKTTVRELLPSAFTPEALHSKKC